MKLPKRLRWTLIVGGGVLVAVLVAVALGHRFLKREIVAQLTELNGGPVVVDRVSLGFQSQAARGIRLLEGEGNQAAWLTARHVELKLSLWEALWGRTVPHRTTLTDVKVALRFDERGKLLSRLPLARGEREWKLPGDAVELVNASVEIRQVGRDVLAIRSMAVQLKQQDASIRATGRLGDLLGSEWTFGGEIDRTTRRTTWEAAAERVRIDSDGLAKLPLVPLEPLQGVRFDAATPVAISGAIAPGDDVHYRVELTPESLSFAAARADLALTNGRGTILVEDGVVSLKGLQGDVFRGRVVLDGNLDLREMPWQGDTQIQVENLQLEQLPESWRLPELIAGNFSGEGRFGLEINQFGPRIQGGGEGSVVDATIMGLAAEPIGVQVVIDRASGSDDDSAEPVAVSGQLRVDVTMKDLNVGQALRQADVAAVESLREAAGRLSLSGSVRAPLESLDDPATYHADGSVELAELELSGVEIREFQSQLAYSKGQLLLSQCVVDIEQGGRIRGQAEVGLGAAVPTIVAKADFEGISSELVSELVSAAEAQISGALSGRVESAVALDRWNDINAWQLSGHAETEQLNVGETAFADVAAQLRLDEGKLVLDEFSARRADTRFEGSAAIDIVKPFSFDSRLDVKGWDLAAAAQRASVALPVTLAGTAEIGLTGRGTLVPFTWNVQGNARLPELTVADFSAQTVLCEWHLDREALELKTVKAELLGGSIELGGKIPFAGDAGVQLAGSFRQFDPSLVLRKFSPASDVTIAGSLSGTFTASHVEDLQKAAGEISIEGHLKNVRGVDVDQISGDLSFGGGTLGIDVRGKAFDGTVGFRGSAEPDDTRPEKPLRVAGRLKIENANLAELATVGGPRFRPLSGRALGEFDLRLEGLNFPVEGRGRVVLQDVGWDRVPLTNLAESDVLLDGNSLRLTKVSARVAGGTVSGDATLELDRPGEGTFSVAVDNVSLSQIPRAWRRFLGGATGSLAANFRGRMGHTWQGAGQVRLLNGNLGGVPIQSLRAPVDWAFTPRTRSLQTRVRLTSARVARGRVSGELRARWSGRLDLSGSVKIVRADMGALAKAAPDVDDLLGGRVSGEVEFRGTNVRSLQNLSGTFDAELVQSQALMLPALEALTASLGVGSPSSKTFSKTEAKGRFSRGILQIDRMTLVSPDTHVFIEGKMNHRGSLDFDVTADAKSAIAAGVVVGVLRPSDLLFRRLIFLHVGGSLRSPIVHLRVEEFIEREIMMFFLPFVVP